MIGKSFEYKHVEVYEAELLPTIRESYEVEGWMWLGTAHYPASLGGTESWELRFKREKTLIREQGGE